MIYALIFACLWSAVGASVFFIRADIAVHERVALAISSAMAFAVIGWIDVASIVHGAHPNHPGFVTRVSPAG